MDKMNFSIKNKLIKYDFIDLFIPIFLMELVLMLNNFISSLVVGNLLGGISVAVIQIFYPLFEIPLIYILLITIGAQIHSSTAKSNFDEELSNQYFTIAMFLLVILGILFIIFGTIFSNNILSFISPNLELYSRIKSYYTLFLFYPLIFGLLTGLSYYVRIDNYPRLASFSAVISLVVIFLSKIFFIKYCGMNVEADMLSIVVGYGVGLIFILQYFFKNNRSLKLVSLFKLNFIKFLNLIKNIVYAGSPNCVTIFYWFLITFAINFFVGTAAGAYGLIAYNLALNILTLADTLSLSLGCTLSSTAPIYYTQNDYVPLGNLLNDIFKVSVLILGIFFILIMIYPNAFVDLFGIGQEKGLSIIIMGIRLYALSIIPTIFTTILTSYYQSILRVKLTNILLFLESLILPILSLFLLKNFIGPSYILGYYVISEVITILIIILSVKYIKFKSKGEYSGIYLFKPKIIKNTFNYSINANKESINKSISNISEFFEKNSISNNNDISIIKKYLEDIYENDKIIDFSLINYDDFITVNIKSFIDKSYEFNFNNEKLSFSKVNSLQIFELKVFK